MAEGGAKADSRSVSLVKQSEYLMKLSSEAKRRFESKVASAGISIDPYAIDKWSQNPEDLPNGVMSCFTWFVLLALSRKRQSR